MVRNSRLTPEFQTLLGKVFLALLVVTVIIIVEGLILWFVSRGGSDARLNSPVDGIYFIVVSIFGETTSPTSFGARVLTLVGLFEGLILATYLIAISAIFTIKGGGLMTRSHKNHFVICGWNFQGARIVTELLNARSNQKFDIVVVPGEEIPDDLNEFGNKVFVVRGSPTDDHTLEAADIRTARSAIILTDTTLPPDSADAKVLMTTLAVETLNRQVYTCAQIMNSENEIHLQRANVDELVLFDVLGANLSVASALTPGITKVLSELVHFDEGSEFYKLTPPLPRELVGMDFKEAAAWLSNSDMILVGVESDGLPDSYRQSLDDGQRGVYVNPKGHQIRDTDALFVIGDDVPDFTKVIPPSNVK